MVMYVIVSNETAGRGVLILANFTISLSIYYAISKGEIVPPGGSSGKKFVLKVLMHQTPPIGMY